MTSRAPRYRETCGIRLPMGFPPEALESALACEPLDDDIFVVSYPKSGTTWLQYIVYLLVRRQPIAANETLSECFPHLEEVGTAAFGSLPRPRLIKTHLMPDQAPDSATARYLFVARNPFDVVVSFYHHTRGFPRHYDFADGSFDDFFDCFVAGQTDFGDYFDHLNGWLARNGRSNQLFLTYERLKADAGVQVRAIADFIGARETVADDRALKELLTEAGIDSMRQSPDRWSSRRPDWAPGFIRKGEVGGWRSVIKPGQTRRLLAKFDQQSDRAAIERLWPDVLAGARAHAEQDGE